MSITTERDFYVAAVGVEEIFADPTYQRILDVPRARKMAAAWDRRLAGILEVSDRGETYSPRYAVIDGQHRWAAAKFLVTPPQLVANVHEGLTIADEAVLFDKLNRQRKQTNTWDHWKARRAGGDAEVAAIEAVTEKHGLRIDPAPRDGFVGCTGALERVVKLGGTNLLDDTLSLIVGAWNTRRDGLDSPIVHGIALVLHRLRDDVDLERLANALIDVVPRQIRTQANAMREMSPGTLPVVTAIVIVGLYNKKPGRKVEVTHKTFGGTGVVNAHRARAAAPAAKRTSHSTPAAPELEQVGSPLQPPRTLPSATPPLNADFDQYADAVEALNGQPVTDIARLLGISERTVRRIRADLGLESA
jgi:hypothetical protein